MHRCDALSCIRRIRFLLRIRVKNPGQGFDPWLDPTWTEIADPVTRGSISASSLSVEQATDHLPVSVLCCRLYLSPSFYISFSFPDFAGRSLPLWPCSVHCSDCHQMCRSAVNFGGPIRGSGGRKSLAGSRCIYISFLGQSPQKLIYMYVIFKVNFLLKV